MDCSLPGFSVHGDSPGKNTGVGCHFLLQGIFLIQGSNLHLLCLLCWWADFFTTDPPGKPYKNVKRILKVYLRAEDKLCRVPHPQIWGIDLTAAHWVVNKFTGWPGQSWFTVARQETTL